MTPDKNGFYVIDGDRYSADFKAYPVQFANNAQVIAIAPGNNAIGTITIQSQTLFLIQQGMFFATNANASQNAGTRLIPLCTVMMIDQGSSYQLTQNPVPVPSLFGDGALPYVWQTPRLCQSLTVLQFQIANFDAAVTYQFRLTLVGQSLYRVAKGSGN